MAKTGHGGTARSVQDTAAILEKDVVTLALGYDRKVQSKLPVENSRRSLVNIIGGSGQRNGSGHDLD
jgi:hypothetical protein